MPWGYKTRSAILHRSMRHRRIRVSVASLSGLGLIVLVWFLVLKERRQFEAKVAQALIDASESVDPSESEDYTVLLAARADAVWALGPRAVKVLARVVRRDPDQKSLEDRVETVPLIGPFLVKVYGDLVVEEGPGIGSIAWNMAWFDLSALGPRAQGVRRTIRRLVVQGSGEYTAMFAAFALSGLGDLTAPEEEALERLEVYVDSEESDPEDIEDFATLLRWRVDPRDKKREGDLVAAIASDAPLKDWVLLITPRTPALARVVRQGLESLPWGYERVEWLNTLWLLDRNVDYQLAQIEELTQEFAGAEGPEGHSQPSFAVSMYDPMNPPEVLRRALDQMRSKWKAHSAPE